MAADAEYWVLPDGRRLVVFRDGEGRSEQIHPSIGVAEFGEHGIRAYVGVWRDTQLIDDDSGKIVNTRTLCLLLDRPIEIGGEEYNFIPYRADVLQTLGLAPAVDPVEVPSLEGWDGRRVSVNQAELFSEVEGAIREYIELPGDDYYPLVALWAVGTYFHVLFSSFPYLFVNGPKRSGKTKLLTLLSCLVWAPALSPSTTAAAVFRLVEGLRATLLLDESDVFSSARRVEELRALLLQGYKAGGRAFRAEKARRREKWIVRAFQVYSPKAIANIAGLEDVLADRCISIVMRRTLNPSISGRAVDLSDPRWRELRTELVSLYLDHWAEVRELWEKIGSPDDVAPMLPEDAPREAHEALRLLRVNGRAWELWRPILVLAAFFEAHGVEGLVVRMLRLAKDRIEASWVADVSESRDLALVRALMRLAESEEGWVPVRRIREELISILVEEEGEEAGRWVTPQWVGRALKRLGLERRRVSRGSEWLITREAVREVALRMGLIPSWSEADASDSEGGEGADVPARGESEEDEVEILTLKLCPSCLEAVKRRVRVLRVERLGSTAECEDCGGRAEFMAFIACGADPPPTSPVDEIVEKGPRRALEEEVGLGGQGDPPRG